MKWIMGAHQTEVGEAASWGRAAEAAAAWASICSWTLVFRAPGNFWTLFYLLISCVCTIRGSFGPALRHSALRARNETEWIIRGLLTPAERNQNFRCQCQSQSQKANWSNSQQTKKNAIISIKMTVYCRFVDIGSQFMCPSTQVGGKFRAGKHGA